MNLQPNEYLKIYPDPHARGYTTFEICGYVPMIGRYDVKYSLDLDTLALASSEAFWFILDCFIEGGLVAKIDKMKLERFGVRYQWER